MPEEIDSLLLEHLQARRNELRDFRNEFHVETDNLKHRMSSLETAMVNVKREVYAGDEADARQRYNSIRSSSGFVASKRDWN